MNLLKIQIDLVNYELVRAHLEKKEWSYLRLHVFRMKKNLLLGERS